jgi:hypothetical protein
MSGAPTSTTMPSMTRWPCSRGQWKDAIVVSGVFDFDGAVFRALWGETKAQQSKFRSYVRYYLSDHRPLWAQVRM